MASLQRHIVEQQCALYVLFRRHCQGCGGTRPIKDYSTRTIQTVYGAVTVESPRLYPCRRCMPGVDFTITPVSELCPDRATAELMTLTAKLGALMPCRAAAEVLADFLPGQMPTRHREWAKRGGQAAILETVSRPSRTAALVTATRCAPCGDHLIRRRFPMRVLPMSSTQPSARDDETARRFRYL